MGYTGFEISLDGDRVTGWDTIAGSPSIHPDVILTGMVPISSLKDDFYTYSGAQRQLIGRQSRRRFSVGDELRVYVARVDAFKRQVDFAIAEEKPPRQNRERERPAKRRR